MELSNLSKDMKIDINNLSNLTDINNDLSDSTGGLGVTAKGLMDEQDTDITNLSLNCGQQASSSLL